MRKPRHKILYIPFKEFEIVDRFKSLIFGLFQYYYKHITFQSSLARYHYYISLSAFQIIAAKKKINSSENSIFIHSKIENELDGGKKKR